MGSQLAKIHLLGANAAKGDLKRPWKASSPFAAFKDLGKEVRYTAARNACMPSSKEATATSRMAKDGSAHWDCVSLLHSLLLLCALAAFLIVSDEAAELWRDQGDSQEQEGREHEEDAINQTKRPTLILLTAAPACPRACASRAGAGGVPHRPSLRRGCAGFTRATPHRAPGPNRARIASRVSEWPAFIYF